MGFKKKRKRINCFNLPTQTLHNTTVIDESVKSSKGNLVYLLFLVLLSFYLLNNIDYFTDFNSGSSFHEVFSLLNNDSNLIDFSIDPNMYKELFCDNTTITYNNTSLAPNSIFTIKLILNI